ncbi:MAG: HAD-IIIC family phosphatase [Bacteroidales bacterium]|nr:HAD-IIIC family phosphatase [Bacteroidales bacterium]
MNYFIFRNNTIERFFPKGYIFSGYDDISVIPDTADGYVWFFQLPVRINERTLCEEIRGYSEKLNLVLDQVASFKPMFLLTMDEFPSIPITSGVALKESISGYNISLFEAQKAHKNVYVLDIREFTHQYAENDLIDWKFWFISQMGLNPRLSKPFMDWFNRKLSQVSLKRKKCLVLDLDNTLWGGILGEDGINGIKLSGSYPGKAYHLFQETLKELCKNGIILTICSKNNEGEALDALDNNPFMILKKGDFSSWRINWKDKVTNIREIAEELNIGLDSMVFIDDNPSERELVRQVLPMVAVPEFPVQPYELPVFCKELVEQYFRVYSITVEDKNKNEQYRANALRTRSQRTFTDMESFLQSLNIHIRIETANEFNVPRIAQMTQKTNQFNLTTRRYSESDILSRLADGWEMYCMSVSDRFGDNGITGCILLNGYEIDSFLLSCRILGKGIESAFLKTVLTGLRDRGIQSVTAEFIPTAKNAQVAEFYDNCGFTVIEKKEDGTKAYSLDLTTADLNVKPYYSVIE